MSKHESWRRDLDRERTEDACDVAQDAANVDASDYGDAFPFLTLAQLEERRRLNTLRGIQSSRELCDAIEDRREAIRKDSRRGLDSRFRRTFGGFKSR